MQKVRNIGIIGLGNPLRHDDGIGLILLDFVRHHKKEFGDRITIIDGGNGGMNLLHVLARFDVVFLIDAVDFEGKPGDTRLFTEEQIQSKKTPITLSTHDSDFLNVISLSKELHELPDILVLFGIQPHDVSYGTGLSDQLIYSLDTLSMKLKKEIQNLIEKTEIS